MGSDKARLEVGGVAMAVRVARALTAAGASRVACIGGDVEGLGVDVAADAHPGEGPLGGIITALRWARGDVVLAAPCDLLVPSADAFTAIVAALVHAPDALVALPVVADEWQPLNAAYAPGALAPLTAAFVAGERSVKRAIAALPRVELVDLDPHALADADTPDELPPVG